MNKQEYVKKYGLSSNLDVKEMKAIVEYAEAHPESVPAKNLRERMKVQEMRRQKQQEVDGMVDRWMMNRQ